MREMHEKPGEVAREKQVYGIDAVFKIMVPSGTSQKNNNSSLVLQNMGGSFCCCCDHCIPTDTN